MNLMFSSDSILATIDLTSEIENPAITFILMTITIVTSDLLILLLPHKVTPFLAKNRI